MDHFEKPSSSLKRELKLKKNGLSSAPYRNCVEENVQALREPRAVLPVALDELWKSSAIRLAGLSGRKCDMFLRNF